MTICKDLLRSMAILSILTFYVKASNYDEYIKDLALRNTRMKEAYLDNNPAMRSVYDHVNSPEYLDGHMVLRDMPNGAESYELNDDEWNDFVQELMDMKNEKEIKNSGLKVGQMQNDEEIATEYDDREMPDYMFQNVQERNLVPRKIEVPYRNELWGDHKIKGGSSEIGTWLDYALQGAKAQDTDEASESQGSGPRNMESEAKNDKLPAYCNPPNPCPLGYDPESMPAPCDEDIEDTKEFNREWIYNKMAEGDCTCDTEHMKDCPDVKLPMGKAYSTVKNTPFLKGQKRSRLVAKKSNYLHVHKRSPKVAIKNPYFNGRILRRVSKKNGGHLTNM